MKHAFLFFSFVGCIAEIKAQFTVQRYYQAVGSATMALNELSSGDLFTGIARQSGVSLMDPLGHILHAQSYALTPFTVLKSVRRHTDNEIYFVGGVIVDSCAVNESLEVDPLFGKMDSLGNILSSHRYQLNAVTCTNIALDVEITADGGAVVWGDDEGLVALRVEHTGIPVWSKQFAHHGSFAFIRELPGGELLAGLNMDTAGVVIARLNSAGDFQWCKSYMRPRGKVQDCVVESDSVFVIAGFTDSIGSTNVTIPLPPDYQPKLFLMTLNGAGDVQWCKGYSGEPRWYARRGPQLVKTLDAKYVLLANIGQPNFDLEYRPFLMKVDQNGDTIWTRSMGKSGYNYRTSDLLACSDGSFYYDGLAYGDFGSLTSAAYLFKTDPLGRLPCDERVHPIEVIDLFPTDSSLTLAFVEGAEAYPISNTFADWGSIELLDSCTLNLGLSMSRSSSRQLQVRPNPNTGRFTVHFDDPLTVDSFYSVYDNVGRLLYQRPLAPGKENEEIDLSRFGKGTYLLRLTNREGVCNERVVVQ